MNYHHFTIEKSVVVYGNTMSKEKVIEKSQDFWVGTSVPYLGN